MRKEEIRVGRRAGVSFAGRPGREILVVGGRVGARLYFVANRLGRKWRHGVPYAGLYIDPDQVLSDNMCRDYPAAIVKGEECHFAEENKERLRFRWIKMAVRGDVRALDHHIQKAMRIIFHGGVKIVIDSKAGRLAGALNQRLEQSRVQELDGRHDSYLLTLVGIL